MSGGSLDYFYCSLEDHVGDFNDKELDELIRDLAKLFYDREWYLSGDTAEGDWREKRDAFKEKWFTKHGREERIESFLLEIGEEVRDSFGISKTYCRNCKYFADERDFGYGKCAFEEHALVHRGGKCEKFKAKEMGGE